jgi:hypothetical protein
MNVWKPTQTECTFIRAAAGKEARMNPRNLVLEPGIRGHLTRNIEPQMNIALISDDPEWNDTDLDDYGSWADFRRGVPLTKAGRAIVDFYIYGKGKYEQLEGNVSVYYENGNITRIHGYGSPDEYPVPCRPMTSTRN